jgi:hypothetical protein
MLWQELKCTDKYWDILYDEFLFRPKVYSPPPIQPPYPYIEFDISYYFNYLDTDITAPIDALYDKALSFFKHMTNDGEPMIALDWQHQCYQLYPHQNAASTEWRIGAFPDGDYHFFLAENCSWGWLGHPWRQTITIFGARSLLWFNEQPL